ncbi:AAA domain, putative AbiEii toxin, Type IV TA system [uncultured archaeon]|nr:AAA domain, putative AbiEii toxin, Type IV TA system [uncultured archaeon]
MLIEFSVENFRSIKERVTLSMVSSSDKSLDNNLIRTDSLEKESLLRSALIYGANASGKSNVILAFKFLKGLVRNSHKNQKDIKIRVSPFKLDADYPSKPSKFEVIFIKNNTKYVYGVSVTTEKVIDEYLYHYPKGRRAILFVRENTTDYKFITDIKEQKFLSERTLENVLYLSSSTQLNYTKLSEAFDWFNGDLKVITPESEVNMIAFTINRFNKDNNLKEYMLKALTEADLGIDDFSASFEKVSTDEGTKASTDEGSMDISKILGALEKMSLADNRGSVLISDRKGNLRKIDVRTIHTSLKGTSNELKVPFKFEEESDGTKKIFSLIGPWIDALSNGRILIVDELDTKLHHRLNLFLIKLFHDPTQNTKNAQLIFTTHNTNLLDLDLFRRDQVWFTEKNPNTGSTDLYSLLEFKPRKDQNIQKGYIAGRYGAIPFISDERIFVEPKDKLKWADMDEGKKEEEKPKEFS